MKSFAPTTSCATWTDTATATSVDLVLSTSNPGAESVWTGSSQPSTTLLDASYSHTAVVKRCSDSLELIRIATGNYLVDSVAPVIDPSSIIPAIEAGFRGDTAFPYWNPVVASEMRGLDT